ncbi:PD-(D/E)XK nuclease family transposase [uncultured Thomasclavelia sp.]|uniref:PD-(D/E)XK nuclease family transposase n=1 Tax=uncultured Thomasclavelia sp. TaxID=3025759 RepID=UPI002602704D|nr:PD-(D/E)XK nuclease family transposase [uncultured Thomasclavelia sp.]
MKETGKKIYDFKSDVLFKYSLANDQDHDSLYLLKLFIEGILKIDCHDIKVLNPDLSRNHVEDKDMILDIRVTVASGKQIDIEMQNSIFSPTQRHRFQLYGAKLLSQQEKKGDRYQNINPVYQIIFINDVDSDNLTLYDTYQSRNEKGKLEKNNLTTRVYVQLPYINVIEEYKGLDKFNELELALYIFANGITDDIMGLEKMKVIGIMKDKMERFNQDEELRLAAYNRELNIQAKNSEMKANYLRGKEEGIEIGKELGKKDEIKNLTLQLFKIKYPDEDIDILANLEVGEYELIFKMLASDQPLEEILTMIK